MATELKNGDLIFDDPVPDSLPGYEKKGKRLFKLMVEPGPCSKRRFTYCPSGCKRYWCEDLAINPGVCVRCQEKLPKTDATIR